jgi:hypothetical protein
VIGLSTFSDIKDEAFSISEREHPTPTTFPYNNEVGRGIATANPRCYPPV